MFTNTPMYTYKAVIDLHLDEGIIEFNSYGIFRCNDPSSNLFEITL